MKKIISYLVVLVIGIVIGYYCTPKEEIIQPTYVISLDSLYRDSVYFVIDSTEREIIYLEKEYEETVSSIMSSSDSLNVELFTRYLNNYNNK